MNATDTTPTPRTRLLGVAVLAFPLLLLASDVAYFAETGLLEGEVGGAIQVWAGAALVLSYVGLVGLFQHRLPRAAALLTLLGAVSATGAVAFGVEQIHQALGAASLVDGDRFAGIAATAVPGLVTPLALVGCAIALLRTRIGPTWAAASLLLGGLVFPVARIGDIAALVGVGDLLLAFGFVSYGLLIVRGAAARSEVRSAVPQPAAT